jgi:hypothetical protein
MAQRAGATTVEERGSHAIYVSHPQAVAALIAQAARAVQAAVESRGDQPESGHAGP